MYCQTWSMVVPPVSLGIRSMSRWIWAFDRLRQRTTVSWEMSVVKELK